MGLKDVMGRTWFNGCEQIESGTEWPHLVFPSKYGVDGLHPGRKVTCVYGQDTIRRVMWHATYGERVDAMVEVLPTCGVNNCGQARHSVQMKRGDVQFGRLRGMSIGETVAASKASSVSEDSIPGWSYVVLPKKFDDYRAPGKAAATLMWNIAKDICVKSVNSPDWFVPIMEARENDGVPLEIEGMCIDYHKLLGRSEARTYIDALVDRHYEELRDERNDAFEDALVTMHKGEWIQGKINQKGGAHRIDVAEQIIRRVDAPTITLLDRSEKDWKALTADIATREVYRSFIHEVEMPEPD